MTNVNKLQLVDSNKLSEVLNLIKKDLEKNKTLNQILNKDEFQFDEAQAMMEGNAKNTNPRKGENVINYLKKKRMLKRKQDGESNVEKENVAEKKRKDEDVGISDDEESHEGRVRKAKQRVTQNEESADNIGRFISRKNMVDKKKGFFNSANEKHISIDDFIYDFSHNARKNYNLSDKEQKQMLHVLKRQRMPAHFIRNNYLRNLYVNMVNEAQSARANRGIGSEGVGGGGDFYKKRSQVLKKIRTL